jgi:hypothetical protein
MKDKTLLKLIDYFIDNHVKNTWIETKHIKVYLRHGYHNLGGVIYNTIDVANVSIPEKYQGQGYFKGMILHLESFKKTIYVESILDKNLLKNLLKNGYTTDSYERNAWKIFLKE